jgi:hypothetical protein
MKTILAVGTAVLLIATQVHSQTRRVENDADIKAIRKALETPPDLPEADTQRWEARMERADTRQAKLTLLHEAWAKSTDGSLPWATRQAWRRSWAKEYAIEARKADVDAAMPNPYPH